MKRALATLAVTLAVVGASPALATYGHGGGWGSSGGHSSGGTPPTNVPEPSDAALVLMGAASLFIGRKLQARRAAKRG